MENFERYKCLKDQLNISHKGIYLNRVLACSIWQLANDKSKFYFNLKHFALLFLSIDVRKLKFDPQNHSVLSTFGRSQRKDHLQLYDSVLDRLDDQVSYNNTLTLGWKISLHPIVGIKIVHKIFQHLRNTDITFAEKIKLSILFVHYCNIIEELSKIDFSKVKKYLSMCSVLDLENLLTQYMKIKGIPTYSLQEGMYFIFKKNPPLDSIQYENFETDNLLCWGKFSVDEDISYGISPDKLCVAGYPKKVEMRSMKRNNPLKRCVVLLARDSYRETNMKLLKILSELSSEYQFYLKLHPSCDYTHYSQYSKSHAMCIISKERTIDACLNNEEYDFCIAVNTTAYYESLMRGLPCFRFYDGTFDLMTGYEDVFATKIELGKCIVQIQLLNYDAYQNDINKMLKYAIGIGVDNYKVILLKQE